MNICKIDSCNGKVAGRGWCKIHWQRWSRTGDPNKVRTERHGMGNRSDKNRIVPEYTAWCSMKSRCYYPRHNRYYKYGGRGITVCERWLNSFKAFYEDMGQKPSPEHSLERKNTNGNYEPSNCKWATRKEQANNKSNNRILTVDGISHTVTQWAEITGVKPKTIYTRLDRGFTHSQAINPSGRRKRLTQAQS